MADIAIQKVKTSALKLNKDNPRRISTKDMDRLVKSLQEFPDMIGIREIVCDENYVVLGGNMRLLALRKIGAKEVTAKIVTGLTPEQKREFVIKDNASFGEWNMDELSAWDNLPLVDWGIKIPNTWEQQPPEEKEPEGRMNKNFNDGKGVDGGASHEDLPPGKYPVTFIFDQEEWELWEGIKARLKLKDDKAAFLKLIGGKSNA